MQYYINAEAKAQRGCSQSGCSEALTGLNRTDTLFAWYRLKHNFGFTPSTIVHRLHPKLTSKDPIEILTLTLMADVL